LLEHIVLSFFFCCISVLHLLHLDLYIGLHDAMAWIGLR